MIKRTCRSSEIPATGHNNDSNSAIATKVIEIGTQVKMIIIYHLHFRI